jgi:hypothetical protein
VAIEEPGVRATLATCGLLKFFECPLIQAHEYLLQFLLQMWSPELHCFLMRGEQIPFTVVEDVYFSDRAPLSGNASTGRACAVEGDSPCYDRPAILFR